MSTLSTITTTVTLLLAADRGKIFLKECHNEDDDDSFTSSSGTRTEKSLNRRVSWRVAIAKL